MNFIAFLRYNYIYIFQNIMFLKDTNFFHLLLRINSKSCRLASGAHFPSVFMIFKTAISFKVFIVGISVFSKTSSCFPSLLSLAKGLWDVAVLVIYIPSLGMNIQVDVYSRLPFQKEGNHSNQIQA